MNRTHSSFRTNLPALLVAAFFLLSCSLTAPATGGPANGQSATGNGAPLPADQFVETMQAGETSAPDSGPQLGNSLDISQAGLPEGFPIYPGGHGFSGTPGIMVAYTVDADVRTASDFYDSQMKAAGWTGFSTGGADIGSCGGDCGPVPTKTPGPAPTSTPSGWMSQNTQMWTSGSSQIMIMYQANPDGGTDITIAMTRN